MLLSSFFLIPKNSLLEPRNMSSSLVRRSAITFTLKIFCTLGHRKAYGRRKKKEIPQHFLYNLYRKIENIFPRS